MLKKPPATRETQVRSLAQEDPLEKDMATHSSILSWRIPTDRGAWQTAVLEVTESDTTERLHFHFTSRAIYLYLLYAYTLKLPLPDFAKPFLTCIINFEKLESNRN